jgi:MFS family permease
MMRKTIILRKALVILAALIIVALSGLVSSFTFPLTSISVSSDVLLLRSQASSTTHSAFQTTTTCYLLQENKSHQVRSKTELATSRIEDDEEDELSDEMNKKNVSGPLTLLLISQFLLFIGVGAVIPSIPLYGKELGFSSAANGIVISAPAVALLLLSKVGGNFADQARKLAMIIGVAIIAVSNLGTALAPGLGTLLVARLGLGAGRCISESGERGLLADLANQVPALRGRALAAQQACVALGIAVGAPLGGIVVENYGPRAAFLCVTAAATVACILYFFLPETQQRAAEEDDDDNKSDSALSAPANADWGDLLSEKQWRGLALCQCGASFGFAAKIASIPILAAATLPGGAIGSGALLSAAGLSGLVGAPIGGWLTDQAGAKTTAMLSGVFSAISLMLIPIALGMPSSSLDDSLSVTLGGVVLSGNALAFTVVVLGWSLGTSAQGPALAALAQKSAPLGAEATAMALPKAAGDGTYIVAPFLLGLVTDAVFNTPGIECAAAGSAILLGVLALAVLGNDVEATALPMD